MSDWKPWFAWRPVTLLTMERAWLCWLERRPTTGWHHFGETDGKWDYAWPSRSIAK